MAYAIKVNTTKNDSKNFLRAKAKRGLEDDVDLDT